MFFKQVFIIILTLLTVQCSFCQLKYYNADTATTHRFLQQLGNQFLSFTPSTNSFTKIIDSILADTEIRVDTIIEATDTSRFYLRGYHSYFNPFALELDSVRTILSEQVNKKTNDTIYLLQTEGIAVGVDRISKLQPYFKNLDEEIRTSFYSSYYSKTKKKKEYIGEGYTYFSAAFQSPKLNITWRKRNDLVAVICITFFAHPVNNL